MAAWYVYVIECRDGSLYTGIPYLRSAVWAVALWGLLKLLWALF